MHAFGKLDIVASCDIGDLGPTEGQSLAYTWNPIYNVIGTLPWVLLAGGFVLFGENRKLQALWIVLPLIIFRLLWAGFTAVADIPSDTAVLFLGLIDCLLIGFTLNWLLAERIGGRNRFVSWLLAWVVFAVVYGATLINLGFNQDALAISIFIGLTVGILMVSFPLAVFVCRKKFGPVRFSLWEALWLLLLTFLFFMIVVFIQVSLAGVSFWEVLPQAILVTLVYAGILIVGLLPYEILLFKNRFWRGRFKTVFGIQLSRKSPVDAAAESESSASA